MTHQILVQDLMTVDVICTHAHSDLASVVRTMRTHRCSCLVVTDDNVPIGVITERDIVSVLADVFAGRTTDVHQAREVMSSPPLTIDNNATLFEALVFAQTQQIRHLPVVNHDGELAGLVTQSDLTHAHHHVFELNRELINANEQLKALSLEDALLEIGNRRAMEVDLQYTHESARRYQRNYSVALLDIDCFKLYNDHYGHAAGDEALRRVAAHLRETIRSADRVYRYGGEELLVLLPETDLDGALKLCGRLVQGIQNLNIPHSTGPFSSLTISAGVAFERGGKSAEASWGPVVQQADKALYAAKENGRNRAEASRKEQRATEEFSMQLEGGDKVELRA